MIVLLPLRGWAGDLMGVQMATSSMVAHVASAMPSDCPMLASTESAGPETDSTRMKSAMECGASCELCIPFAELAGSKLEVVTFASHVKPLAGRVDFMSAAPAP